MFLKSPHQGYLSKMNSHLIRFFKINSFTSTDLKDLKLLVTKKAGVPRRAIKRRIGKTKVLRGKSQIIFRLHTSEGIRTSIQALH